ncbi:MAG: 50S ribosomal protein L4 [Bacteroidota bacterium]|nr:50S ribosomal protein L4 [Bacteroidota bacterium]
MKLKVYNNKGQETGNTLDLNDAIFAVEPNDHAIYLDCKQHLANKRQGTHKTKERSDVKGSTKKIKRQKGTGTARAGDIKNPVFRGGGRIFGPRPKSYNQKINKKTKRLARKSALSYKIKDGNLFVIDDFGIDEIKTRKIAEIQDNFKISEKNLVIVVNQQNNNLYLSSRNLPGVNIVSVSNLNTYDILKASVLMFDEESIKVLNENLA